MKRVVLNQTLSGYPRQIIIDDNVLHVKFGRPILVGFVLSVCSFIPFAILVSGAYEIRDSYASAAIMFLIGAGFLAIGSCFIFGRAGLIIDKRKEQVIQYRRLFVRFPLTRTDIRGAQLVRISHVQNKGKGGPYIVDKIELVFADKPP